MTSLLLELKKHKTPKQARNNNPLYYEEYVIFCPHCKNMETIWIGNGSIQKERRYRQRNGQLYHDCGSTQPCRLYGLH